MTVKTEQPKTMREVLGMLESRLNGKRVFRYMDDSCITEISAERFFHDIRAAAAVLRKGNLAGRHIGIMGRNSYGWLVSLCAVFRTESAAVLLDREISSGELSARLRKTDVSGIIYDSVAADTVRDADLTGRITGIPMEELFDDEEERGGDPASQMSVVSWENYEKQEGQGKCTAGHSGDSLACIFFTSGTTGESKAVMMSERGLTAGICHRINNRGFHSLLAVLPFHHLSGFSSVLNALYLGAEVCIATDIKYFYRYLEVMKPDYVFVVPSMLRMLARKLKNGGNNGRNLGWDLHLINCGGADFRPEFLQMLLERNITVLQGYGASEAGAIGFLWKMTPERPDTIGKPPAEMKARIIDGELYVKSDAVMVGYYGDAEETEKVLTDGWYATGDLCRMDEEGFFYLTGRRKNLIILANGENISPEEIERKLLYEYDDISDVVVCAEGDLITAQVYPGYPDGCTAKEKTIIQERIREEIRQYNESEPVYRQIMKICFPEGPAGKTSSGKLLRRRVQEEQKDEH